MSGSVGNSAASGVVIGGLPGNTAGWNGEIDRAWGFARGLSESEFTAFLPYARAVGFDHVVICDGDSLTFGGGVTAPYAYPAQMKPLLAANYCVFNLGVSGQTVEDMASDYATQVVPLVNGGVTCIYVCWEAVNSLLANDTDAQILAAYYALCDLARATGFKVVVVNIPKAAAITSTRETYRVAINGDLAANWALHGDAFVDLASLAAFQDTGDATYYYVDGTHYTATGYGIVAASIQAAVESL